MNAIEKNMLRLALAVLPALLQGCGTLAAPQMLALSMASTVVGGYANGGLMGGSTVGVIHNIAFGDGDDSDGAGPAAILAPAKTDVVVTEVAAPKTVAAVGATSMPRFANGLERACYFPNASGRGLPCT